MTRNQYLPRNSIERIANRLEGRQERQIDFSATGWEQALTQNDDLRLPAVPDLKHALLGLRAQQVPQTQTTLGRHISLPFNQLRQIATEGCDRQGHRIRPLVQDEQEPQVDEQSQACPRCRDRPERDVLSELGSSVLNTAPMRLKLPLEFATLRANGLSNVGLDSVELRPSTALHAILAF
jgi:hypothetical protein